MSRISRYQDSVTRFIKNKSAYSDVIKASNIIDTIIKINDRSASIILLTVMNGQCKKRKIKAHHGYYIASGIDLMMTIVILNDNIRYFKNKYDKYEIKNFIKQAPMYIIQSYMQNIDVLNDVIEKDKLAKLQKKIFNFINSKLLDITKYEKINTIRKVHKTDIIKYKFSDKNLIESTYRNLNLANDDELLNYVERTYGSACQCCFVMGWLFGTGDEKSISALEKLGTYLGYLIKLSIDFENLERDLKHAKYMSLNLIINLGIHKSFNLFDENKVKLIEGCMLLGIYNITIKEVMDNIEKKFDLHLQKSDLELISKYSSFSEVEK